MRDLMGQISSHAKFFPKKIALVDNGGSTRITYEQVEYISGKVYAYLKNAGIGKEDFVAICLPRSSQPIITMLGVWKAGAAFVMLEDQYPAERKAYIIEDCKCKLTIDSEVWQQIQNTPYLPGHEMLDEHQAALAVYTSGSTGNPKGVVHEFGNIDRIDASSNYQGQRFMEPDDIYALMAPLTFIAGSGTAIMVILGGATLHILSYAILKNPVALEAYVYEHKLTKITLSPTLYRAMRSISPYLKQVMLGGEPISNLYTDKLQLLSVYSMSECGAVIAAFEIDKPYDNTPIGKPQCDMKVWLLDEDGNEVPDGESGELCIDNPYVRGYIGLSEENASAFGAKGIYHTGDIAKKLPDGNLILLGRCNDMIKISGNRVEPAEVEAAVRKVLNIDWCVAKSFTVGRTTFICAYYTADIEIDYGKTRKKMLDLVPYYMVPSYFIKLDHIPQNANGKVDKKSLQPPVFDSFRAPYAAPSNEWEEKLCRSFEKVLEAERIGIHDDFYNLGGDSLGSMMVVAESGIPGLTINDIYRGRTPERIAELFRVQNRHRKTLLEGDSDIERERKMRLPHALGVEQTYMVDYQLYTPMSTMYNLGGLFCLGADVDAQKLANAMNATIAVHPALNTILFFNSDGDIVQRYAPELFDPIEVEQVSEQEFALIKQSLIRPFKIIRSALFRGSVFKTEKACYMFLDIHHTVCDGTSYNVLLRDISAAYSGSLSSRKDCYYELLRARECMTRDPFYLESKEYYEKLYSDKSYDTIPTPDLSSNARTMGELNAMLDVRAAAIDRLCKTAKISRNGFFITVCLLSMSAYNGSDKVRCSWIHNGRDTVEEMDAVGLLIRSLLVAVELKPDMRVIDLLSDVRSQITGGLEHICYPYNSLTSACVLDDSACILYQENIHSTNKMCGADMEYVPVPRNHSAFQNALDIELFDTEDGIAVEMDYAECTYTAHAMRKYLATFQKVAANLAAAAEKPEMTVSDVRNME